MPDLKLSGYKATIQTVTFSGTQTLNSLVNGEWTNLSDEIDNGTNLYAFADLELVVGSASYTGDGSRFEFFLVPAVDGTPTYPDWTGNVTSEEPENQNYAVGRVLTSAATGAQRLVFRDVPLPNGKYKWGIRNQAGATTPASGNTFKWRPHQLQSA